MSLGKKLKSLRAEYNLSQPELAEKIGIEQSYLSKLENDKSIPSNDIFNRILDAFNLKLAEFMASFTEPTELIELQQIPDIRQFLERKKSHSQQKQRKFLYVSSLLIVIACTAFYTGFSKQLFPALQYQYESKGIILDGESEDVFDNRSSFRAGRASPDVRLEIQKRLHEKVLISSLNKGNYFVIPVKGGSRKYFYMDFINVPQPINAWLQMLGIFLFSAGIMGFVLERRLFRVM